MRRRGYFSNHHRLDQGATALLVVVFCVLILTIISVGFIRLVVQDQQRSTDDILSRGAYDSANAGVEDGKRVLQSCIGSGNATACNAIASGQCNTIHAAKILSASDDRTNQSEVVLQNSSGTTGGYDQAYTCVKISRGTSNYEGSLSADVPTVVPLTTVDGFTEVTISWFKAPSSGSAIDISSRTGLPVSSNWSASGKVRPPIMRAQLIQFNGGSFKLDDFNQSGGANTLYFYPSSIGASELLPSDFSLDVRRTPDSNGLQVPVKCSTLASPFICSVTVKLPLPVGMPASPTPAQLKNRQAYLELTSEYGGTDFMVQPVGTMLWDVEPSIDSTGRASNVFRRLNARVQLVSSISYPRATVDITKNFCKDFQVLDTSYIAGTCDYTKP